MSAMNERIVITGNLPEKVILPLQEKYDIEMNHEDRPLDHHELLLKIKDKQGLLPMLSDSINEKCWIALPI
jgi:hypothetical protein